MYSEEAFLISVLRHWECGLSGPCVHYGDEDYPFGPVDWCCKAGEWLEKHNITAKDLVED